MIKKLIEYNQDFVHKKQYEAFPSNKIPKLHTAIVSCMDTRLVTMLPAALGIQNGDVKMIKAAGGTLTGPYDSVVRSILISIFQLQVEHIIFIAHTSCGVKGLHTQQMEEAMQKGGISSDRIALAKQQNPHFEQWLNGFEDEYEAVRHSISILKNHPLIPESVSVDGFVIDILTGQLYSV